MALETADAFELMATAYRTGLLDKALPLVGQAVEGFQEQTGLDYGYIVMRMDEAGKETIEKLDRFYDRFGFMFRLVNNERLMGLFARLMEIQTVKRATVSLLKRMLVNLLKAEKQSA